MKHPASEPPADTVKSEADGCEPDPAALRSEDHERQAEAQMANAEEYDRVPLERLLAEADLVGDDMRAAYLVSLIRRLSGALRRVHAEKTEIKS